MAASTVAEFSLDNTVWRIKAGPNGASYIIESQGDFSQTARWYIPRRKRNSVNADSSGTQPMAEGRKFYFTTILPDTKQHPIIASMTETNLEISDSYTIASREEEIITDQLTRKLIIVSGAWVFFMEGWSNSYKVNQTSSAFCPRSLNGRALSMPSDPTRRRSIFAPSPSRSPSLPTPVEGLSSPSLGSSKSPSPEPQNPPDGLGVSEAAIVSEGTVSPSSQATIVSKRKVSQTSQKTMSDTSTQYQQPEPDPSTTIMLQTDSTAATNPRTPGPAVVPRVRAPSDIEDKAVKRRSWSHHEVPHWVRQGGLGSLSRSMSSRLKRERPSIHPTDTDANIAPNEDQPPARQEGGLRHLRRISHQLRHLNPTKTDAVNITTAALQPYTPIPQPSSFPESRPNTAKSFAGTEIITFENADPFDAPPNKVPEVILSETKVLAIPLALPTTLDGPISAAQSTETLPDPTQVSWWQQYDQFMQQHQHQYFQKLERHISPVVEDVQVVEAPDQRMPSLTSTVSPTSPSSAAGSRRLSSWKEKLKTKLHV